MSARTPKKLVIAVVVAVLGVAAAVGGSAGAAPPLPAPPHGCAPPVADRVALWRGEDSAEDSVQGLHGSLSAAAGYTAGLAGRAFDLSGAADHVAVPDAAVLDITGDLTLEAWVKFDDTDFSHPDELGVGGNRVVFWKVDDADQHAAYTLFVGNEEGPSTAPLAFFHGDRAQPGSRAFSQPLLWQADTWYHVAATRSGREVSFYRDGQAVGAAVLGQDGPALLGVQVALGAAALPDGVHNPLLGDLDEAGIWKRALSAGEIRAIHDTVTGVCKLAPDTTIDSGPSGSTPNSTSTFTFSSDDPAATFECRVDGADFAACASPRPTAVLAPGEHTFDVRAVDARGTADPSPASRTFTVAPVADPPRNTFLPSIIDAAAPHTYRCHPGTWVGADPARPYSYTWHRVTVDIFLVGGLRYEQVSTAETYRPALADAGDLRSQRYRCVVTAANAAGSTRAFSAVSLLTPAPAPAPAEVADVRVSGIEVTQGIQWDGCVCEGTLPSRDQSTATTPGRARYQGVRMVAGNYTVVRVFANFTQPTRPKLAGATARLEVLDADGRRISLLSPNTSPAALLPPTCGACVSLRQRANAGGSFNFNIPWQQTVRRSLSFRATVSPPIGLGEPRQCATCRANTFELIGVPFVSTAAVPIVPIPLTVGGMRTAQTETQVFGDSQTVLPMQVRIAPYAAPLMVDRLSTLQALAAVSQRASDNGIDATRYPVGVYVNGVPGLGGATLRGRRLYDNGPPISIVQDSGRPLTSVMHEIGHGLGLPHADTGSQVVGAVLPLFTGPHPDGTPDCGGNSNGQIGESWPTDDKGRIQGIGLDRRAWQPANSASLPRTIVDGRPNIGTQHYDFMSYCGKNDLEGTHWISVRNWERLLDFHPPAQALRAAPRRSGSAAIGAPLRVIATVDPTGKASIFDIEPGQTTAGTPTVGSPYRVELRDAAGKPLSSVVATTTVVPDEGQRDRQRGLLLEATLPFAASGAAVVVTNDGREIARRARGAHAPTARLISPRPGSRIGAAKTTLVRWTASDADGDRLSATVDYSRDGGRHWKVVAGDSRGRSARVPGRALSASRNGMLRVRVSDGFDVATATSGTLRAAGAAPLVRITGDRGGRVRADAQLLLTGTAFDDAGTPLTGAQLRWYAGRRYLGRGERLTVRRLPAGSTAIRLVATDARGRSSRAERAMKVIAARPEFLIAKAPARVARTTRKVRIVVATNVPAVLTIAGARHRVNRKPRTITITIRPGRSTLRLTNTLRSPGGITRGSYTITR